MYCYYIEHLHFKAPARLRVCDLKHSDVKQGTIKADFWTWNVILLLKKIKIKKSFNYKNFHG